MRKLTTSLRSGYNSLTWDMRYLTNRGPKVPPGVYTVAIDKNIDGEFTRLVEPQAFKIKALPNALGTPNYAENFNFLKEVNDLNALVNAARVKIKNMNTRLKNMKKILATTPVEANVLVNKMNALQKEVDALAKVVIGGFGAKNTVSSRIRFAQYTTASAEADITGAQKEQYNLAKNAFAIQAEALSNMFDVKLPALETEFEEVGGILFNNAPERRRYWEE
jgi:hypothetical protein